MKHFYERNGACPSATSILLTDAIKTHVITYRQYNTIKTDPANEHNNEVFDYDKYLDEQRIKIATILEKYHAHILSIL
jgi:hypothetical protein